MPSHTNFFETTAEARMRLRGTIILYDGVPHYVHAISDHKSDGIFRIYLSEVGKGYSSLPHIDPLHEYGESYPSIGALIDKWMENYNGTCPVIRKMMNSPAFNKFRPFPLGMCNYGNSVLYIERQPTRKSEQGLINGMLNETILHCNPFSEKPRTSRIDIFSDYFRDCITGTHPSAQETLTNLLDPTIANEAVAFHRNFAFVRGPMDTIFLGYKGDIIGILPNQDLTKVKLGTRFQHTREVVETLGIFASII